ncbi:MAG: fibronectin type III domain-containing protein [Candidatus Levyibacteriota bacterium]|nr:MAG: fibronectin type III domain-containing protein [Candidatus Levybacteria bacterium]
MKNTIWQIKIPTLLGIMLILVGIALTSFFTKKGIPFISKASISETPENIRVTNITDTSFTVSYTTSSPFLGSIMYSPNDKMENTAIDDEDSNTKSVQPRLIHNITIANLQPSTNYYFSILSGETTFLNNGKPFTVTTGPTLNLSSATVEMRGSIIFLDTMQKDAIIYITSPNSQVFSTHVKQDGAYTFNLSSLRGQDLTSYISLSKNDVITMLIVGTSEKSNVALFASQANSVPLIIISKDYDFTINDKPIHVLDETIGFPSFTASPSASKATKIISPKKNESFTDTQPTFKGVASPGTEVKIEINSEEEIKTSVTSDKNGSWSFRPKNPLSPGKHTILITTRDQFGILKTIKQSFTVYAQGSQVNQSATPSATLTPKASITSSPTPTIAKPSPTETPTPTLKPTGIPTPTKTQIFPPIEPPGNSSIFPIGISAFSAIITGLIILRFLRNKYVS